MSNYCKVALEHPLHRHYHDTEYGYPITGEAELFERLVMEIFQAGLSWLLILKKREALKLSFENFDVTKVANFNDNDVKRLLENHLIIRNRKKIEATILNAKRLVELRKTDNGFSDWIEKFRAQFTTSYSSKSDRCIVRSKRGGPCSRDRLSQAVSKYC